MSMDVYVNFAIRAENKTDAETAIRWQMLKEELMHNNEWINANGQRRSVPDTVLSRDYDGNWFKEHGFESMEEWGTWGMFGIACEFSDEGMEDLLGNILKVDGQDFYEIKVENMCGAIREGTMITGETGELRYLLKNNPNVWIEGSCTDDFDRECCIKARWDEKSKSVDGCLGLGWPTFD